MKKKFALLLTLITIQLLGRPAINWNTPPVALSSIGVDASDQHLAVDSNGNTNAIWVQNSLIMASTLPFNGSWSTPAQLSTTGNTALSPRIAIDGSGNATAVWIENSVVKTASLPLNGSWGASSTVSASGASSPALAVDSTGNIVIVWIGSGFVQTSTKLLGGLLSLVHTLSTNGSESNPNVAIGGNGRVIAVWHSQPSGNDAVFFATSQVNGTWSSSAAIIPATTSLHHNFPIVVVDASGNATAIWFRYNFTNSTYANVQALAASLPSASSTWGTFTLLSNSGLYNPSNLTNDLQVDGTGNVVALWTNSYNGTTFAVESATLPFGGAWALNGELQLQNLYGFSGDISASPSGYAVAAYMNFDGTNLNTQVAESDIGGKTLNFWSNQTNISTGTDNAYPTIAVNDSSGTIFASSAWLQNNGSNNILTVTTGSASNIASPTSFSVSQSSTSFGTFTDYYNTLNWTLSTDPNIVEYLLYRNGVFFTAVDPTATQYVDHNAVQNGTVTYGITAVDDEFALSPVVTFTLF